MGIEIPTIGIMKEFPDWTMEDFDMEEYNSRFQQANIIIDSTSKVCAYPPHWGPLSIKTAFFGEEFYRKGNSLYRVGSPHYLILNESGLYSSYIDSKTDVNSFTINFSPAFEKEVTGIIFSTHDYMLDNEDFINKGGQLKFIEQLYKHDHTVSPFIFRLRSMSQDWEANKSRISELLYFLFESMVNAQRHLHREIKLLESRKQSTKEELYKRLIRAKDYIYSSYNANLTLEEMGNIACLNHYYFLRQFKKAFHMTPFQYLTQRRLDVASSLIKTTDKSITDICTEVGYADIASFSRLFKRTYNKSPLSYRKFQH